MKTTRSNVKRTVLIGTLVLSLGGLTGCNSTHKSEETEDNKKIVELQPNELSLEETKVLKVGDVVPKGKEVNRELLEQQGMDYVYVYGRCSYDDEGSIVENSQRIVYSYVELPSEKIEEIAKGIVVTTKYTFKNEQIVSIEFVKDETGMYKKKLILDNAMMELVDVIDENNIDKDKVKTLK